MFASTLNAPCLTLLLALAACSAGGGTSPAECGEDSPTDCSCAEARGCSPDDATADEPTDASGRSQSQRDSSSASGNVDAGRATGTASSTPLRDASPSTASDAARPDDNLQADSGGKSEGDGGVASAAPGIVAKHGALRVSGNRVVDRAGQPVQLRGMSLFWSQWSEFYLPQTVDVLVDDWKAGVVRAALGVENEGGYLTAPAPNVAKLRAVVDRAIARGIYVIIDWHDHHAQDHSTQALAFFTEMAKSYGKQPHVIFEIYNEPVDTSWSVVKAYAEPLITSLRKAGAENLIIVGTPNWSQDVDVAASDRIASDENVAYTLHFYAATHKQALRDKAKTALDRGIALFVTEWGTCSADGNGTVDEGETQSWLSFLASHSVSWANWALNDKAEACSALLPNAGNMGPWRNDQLTPSGLLVKRAIP